MSINGVSTNSNTVNYGTGTPKVSTNSAAKTYKRDDAAIAKLNQTTQANITALQNLVNKLLGKQANAAQNKLDNVGLIFDDDLNLSGFSFEGLEIDEATAKDAAALIADDGPLGAKAVSDNILNFAKALSGGDPSKVDELKSGFLKGYNEVARMFGGADNMPDVCKQTYDMVMKGFSEWSGTPVSAVEVEA